jgi:circadian clock protein KaiB
MTPTSAQALENLKNFCEEHLQGLSSIQIIDLLEHPTLARGGPDCCRAHLVGRSPTPVKKIVGDLSNAERVLAGLELRPAGYRCSPPEELTP